jgi:hypothetical protein
LLRLAAAWHHHLRSRITRYSFPNESTTIIEGSVWSEL